MDQEIKGLWTAALRSGNYQQGTGVLKRYVRGQAQYCCLGVLCEVAKQAGVKLRESYYEEDSTTPEGIASYDGYDDYPPVNVWNWAGLPSANPSTSIIVPEINVRASLSYLNDNGKTFEEIADIIEREF